ncbi:MAG: LysM peptidoglycan-binding domain-containing protein [Bacilli bacterium]|nr:LysM peptidoglycan-binding domain-containing protein [Bacilli bacterium]
MEQKTRQIASLALAGAIIAGAHISKASADTVIPSTTVEETNEEELSYTVCEGDTLGGISEKYFGTPIYYQQLADYNHIVDATKIYVGQEIRIPNDLTEYLIPSHPREYLPDDLYIVQEGDYLFDIAKKLYDSESILTVDRLATYNNLMDPNLIHEGDVLYIPEKDKLDTIEPRDYTLQYMLLEWRINHPGERYPDSYIAAIKEQLEELWEQGITPCCPRPKVYVMK